jgi:hypothetical protein
MPRAGVWAKMPPVGSQIIISYDGSPTDDDGLVLGALLARAGASVALAYVRHSREFDPGRERLAQHDAERRLEQGAAWLGRADSPRHVVVNPSTSAGLRELVEREGAQALVFGSDYRTPPGQASPGATASGLLEGGAPVAIALAAAGLRARRREPIGSVSALASDDESVTHTAETLASRLEAPLLGPGDEAELVLVGSAPSASPGRILLDGPTRNSLAGMRGSVIVLPRATALAL